MASSTPSRTTVRPTVTASPGSPTRLSRLQEKEELRHLNDRLAAYIERVRSLEADKSLLKLQLEEREDVTTREVSSLRLLYETELADARKLLDHTANERARLQVELGKVLEEQRQLQTRNNKKENDLSLAQNLLRDIEAKLNAKEAELATALGGKRTLEEQLQDLKAQICYLESSLNDTTKQLHNEMLCRVDLENKMQTVREQLAFEKNLHEQEVREMKNRHESRIIEIDSGRRIEFESKLAEALQELRNDHEQQISAYKEQLERNFSAKIHFRNVAVMSSEVIGEQSEALELVNRMIEYEVQDKIERRKEENQLENAQLAATKNSDYANATREEIKSTKLRVDSLTSQLSQYHKQNSALDAQLRDLQERLDHEHDFHRRQMNEKDREVSEMRHKLQGQLEEYEQLLDVKLALDMEINAYRKMLEGEEQRLKLSPSPSQRGAVARTTADHRSHFLRGKKRKLEDPETEAETMCRYKIVQQASATGAVSIDEIDPEGNFVRLVNSSEEDQPLHGWKIKRLQWGMPEIVFTFPNRFVLKTGHQVTIWSASDSAVHSPPSDLVWRSQQSWGTGDKVKVILLDSDGDECAERMLLKVRKEEGETTDEELLEEEFDSHFRPQSHQPLDPSCCVM